MCRRAASSATRRSKLRWPGEQGGAPLQALRKIAAVRSQPATAHLATGLRMASLPNIHPCLAVRPIPPRSGKLTSSSLDTYSCVALAGVATEWLRFGHAEGGLADVQQLDRLLQALRFTQVCPALCCSAGFWGGDAWAARGSTSGERAR